MTTIDELLKSLQRPSDTDKISLSNTKETWSRIGQKDSFAELGLEPSALEEFLKEWTSTNEYSNL